MTSGCARRSVGLAGTTRLDPVQTRVAISATNPPDNAPASNFVATENTDAVIAELRMKTLSPSRYRAEWFDGVRAARRDVLAGMVGTFALIPEVIAFSFVAGIDPEVGLFASFVIG